MNPSDENIFSVLLERLQEARGGDRSPHIGPTLSTYSEGTLRRLYETVNVDRGDNGNLEYTLSTMIDTGIEERWLNETMTYAPMIDEYPHVTRECISALRQYDLTGLLPDDSTEEGRHMILTLLLTTYWISSDLFNIYDEELPEMNGSYPNKGIVRMSDDDTPTSMGWCLRLTDERLIKLILNHPEEADRIRSVVKERGTADYDTILPALTNASRALASGAL